MNSVSTVNNPEAHYIGTEPWKPKEALEEDGLITDKADIFAFGLTLWEMMTLSIPHLNLLGDDDGVYGLNFSWLSGAEVCVADLPLCREGAGLVV